MTDDAINETTGADISASAQAANALNEDLWRQLREIAEAWVRDPLGPSAQTLIAESAASGRHRFGFIASNAGQRVQWSLATVHQHATTFGAYPSVVDDSGMLAEIVGLFTLDAGIELARLVTLGTGMSGKDIAEHLATATMALTSGQDAPSEFAAVVAWLATHWGGAEHVGPLLRFLGSDFRAGLLQVSLESAERRAEEGVRKVPTLRRGTHFLRTLLTTDHHVQAAIRKRAGKLDPGEAEFRRMFKYEPLGAAERLVMHALATHARAIGALDSHPWATASGAMPKKLGEEPPRVIIEYPGTSEIARILGYSATASGKISGARRKTIERAIRDLIDKPRWIATRVLLPPVRKGGEWIDDIEVRREAWVVPSHTLREGARRLELHPAAIASHLKSFEDVPDLAARYDAARDALGARELRDEWAIADDYVRYLALAITARTTAKQRRTGEVPASTGATAGALVLPKRLSVDTLTDTLGLTRKAKKQGRPWTRERIREALTFCQHMGSVRSFTENAEAGMYDLMLPHPDSVSTDDDQLLLLAPEGADSPN